MIFLDEIFTTKGITFIFQYSKNIYILNLLSVVTFVIHIHNIFKVHLFSLIICLELGNILLCFSRLIGKTRFVCCFEIIMDIVRDRFVFLK